MFPSALAVFYAPSDLSGVKGMKKECIHLCLSWRGGPTCHDCAFVEDDENLPGFCGLAVICVQLFFLFKHYGSTKYPCTLILWYVPSQDTPCKETGMWIVEPELNEWGVPVLFVIHSDCMLCAAHLIGVSGHHLVPCTLRYTDSLDAFNTFYVNKYTDHYTHEIAF